MKPDDVVDVSVVVEPAAVRRTSGGSVVGPLELRFGEQVFPQPGWSDFVLVVLGWLVDALERVDANEEVSVSFMDGPFELALAKDGDRVRVHGVERRRQGAVDVLVASVDWAQWARSSIASGEQVVESFDDEAEDHDRDALEAAVVRLRALLGKNDGGCLGP